MLRQGFSTLPSHTLCCFITYDAASTAEVLQCQMTESWNVNYASLEVWKGRGRSIRAIL
jgi:hypothetical protein